MAGFSKERGRKIPLFLTVDEVYSILQKAKQYNQRDFKMLMLLYYFGLRNTEMTTLHKEDINLTSKPMTLKIKGSDKKAAKKGAKGGKDRIVPIADFNPFHKKNEKKVAEYLAMWMGDGKGLLIEGDTKDGGISDRTVRRVVKKYAIWAEVSRAKEVHPHTLRHCYATHLRNMGVPQDTLQTLLGHAKGDTTKIYSHMSASTMESEIMTAVEKTRMKMEYPGELAKVEAMPEGNLEELVRKDLAYNKLIVRGQMVGMGIRRKANK